MESNYVVDIHSHLLPGIDDGAYDTGMTLAMIHIAYDHGVRQLFVTPHSYCLKNNPDSIVKVFRQIESKSNHIFPDLQLFLGCEVFCDIMCMDEILRNLSEGVFFSMNGTKYVLVEFSLWVEEESICSCVDQLLSHNWIPILSHVERYINLLGKIETAKQLRKRGCLFQANIYSFSEHNQSGNRNWARTLIAHRMVDFLGTDAHNVYFRPPDITQGLEYLHNVCRDGYLKEILFLNAKSLLTDQTGQIRKEDMMTKIVVMGGSFNPPTIAHQRLLLDAVTELGAYMGIFVPSSHTYVSIKMRRAKLPKEVLREDVRLRMLEAMCEDDPRLTVDDCEFHRTEKGYTYESMEAIQEKYPEAELYFLAGGDKVSVISRWHRIREFLDRFKILVVKRDGDDPETGLRENPFLCQHLDRFRIIPAPDGIEGISSSAVRNKLRNGEPGAEEMLHPGVWEILLENGGMKK